MWQSHFWYFELSPLSSRRCPLLLCWGGQWGQLLGFPVLLPPTIVSHPSEWAPNTLGHFPLCSLLSPSHSTLEPPTSLIFPILILWAPDTSFATGLWTQVVQGLCSAPLSRVLGEFWGLGHLYVPTSLTIAHPSALTKFLTIPFIWILLIYTPASFSRSVIDILMQLDWV